MATTVRGDRTSLESRPSTSATGRGEREVVVVESWHDEFQPIRAKGARGLQSLLQTGERGIRGGAQEGFVLEVIEREPGLALDTPVMAPAAHGDITRIGAVEGPYLAECMRNLGV